MSQRTEDSVEHILQILADILCEKAQYQVAVLLQQQIFAPVSTVRDRIGKVLVTVES